MFVANQKNKVASSLGKLKESPKTVPSLYAVDQIIGFEHSMTSVQAHKGPQTDAKVNRGMQRTSSLIHPPITLLRGDNQRAHSVPTKNLLSSRPTLRIWFEHMEHQRLCSVRDFGPGISFKIQCTPKNGLGNSLLSFCPSETTYNYCLQQFHRQASGQRSVFQELSQHRVFRGSQALQYS